MAKTPDNRPWAPHPIPPWIIKEFQRRQNDIGFEYPTNITWDDNGNWQNYKGPMTAWVRLFSNGTGRVTTKSDYPEKSGFVLQGGAGFDKVYGIPDNKNVLGYDAEGQEHTLNLSENGNFVSFPNSISPDNRTVQKFLPIPGITSIDAVLQKERIRKITVNWKCYGYAQLEYMTPYFLTPKISAFVEFGWNHFNPASLLDLRSRNLDGLRTLFLTGSFLYDQNIKNSYGLYDVTMGIISGFDFSSQDGITFDCKTEILSKHANYSGVLVNSAAKVSSDKEKTSVQSTFAEYLDKRLTKLPNCIINNRNFMEPLDTDEEKALKKGSFLSNTLPFYKYEDGNYFKSNKKRTEDRMFLGRRDEYKDKDLKKGASSYDWDYSDQKDIWVTMGFLVELANIFFTKPITVTNSKINGSDESVYQLYEIDIDDVKIGAHPNLISCDGSILLIPNSNAPKYNKGYIYPVSEPEDNDYQKQFSPASSNSNIFLSLEKSFPVQKINDLSPPDKSLFKIFKTGKKTKVVSEPIGEPSYFDRLKYQFGKGKLAQAEKTADKPAPPLAVIRDDLNRIINRFRHRNGITDKSSTAFPQSKKDPETNIEAGYWGYLKDLYINKNIIVECAKSADTVEKFYNTLLDKINNAAGKIWDLAVIEDTDDSGKLKIIDKKFVQYHNLKIYQFDVGATNKFIKNISFTAQLSNVAANQVISSASTNTSTDGSPNGDVTPNQIIQFPYGDRFNIGVPSNPKKIDENLETIKQLQNSPQNAGGNKGGSYIMSFKTYKNENSSTQPTAEQIAAATAAARAGGGAAAGALGVTADESEVTGWNIVNLVLPNESLLIALMNDMDFKNSSNIYGGQQPGFTIEMTLQGISGLRTFQLFSLKNLPSPYSEREIICQVVDITHKVENGNWTTTIKAGVRSIRGQVIKFTTDGINEYTINTIK